MVSEPIGEVALNTSGREIAVSIPLTKADGAIEGTAELDPRGNKGIEDRLQIECGAADDLEHVGGRGLLLQRF